MDATFISLDEKEWMDELIRLCEVYRLRSSMHKACRAADRSLAFTFPPYNITEQNSYGFELVISTRSAKSPAFTSLLYDITGQDSYSFILAIFT